MKGVFVPSNKMDPRVIRTKQLLVEAFLNVSQEKEMTQITVKILLTVLLLIGLHFTHTLMINMKY